MNTTRCDFMKCNWDEKMKIMKGHTVAHNVKDNLSSKIEVIQLKAR